MAVLPAAAALPTVPSDADPGLAKLERGYKRWQDLRAQRDALEELEADAHARAADRLPEWNELEPVASDTVKRLGKMLGDTIDQARDPASPVSIPSEMLAEYDDYWAARSRWNAGRPTIPDDDPDYLESKALEAKADALWKKAMRLRGRLLRVPTTSPRGLMIKLALAIEVESLADMEKHLRRPYYYGVNDYELGTELVPALLADLRAMVGAVS
jgi:hypothetical protein